MPRENSPRRWRQLEKNRDNSPEHLSSRIKIKSERRSRTRSMTPELRRKPKIEPRDSRDRSPDPRKNSRTSSKKNRRDNKYSSDEGDRHKKSSKKKKSKKKSSRRKSDSTESESDSEDEKLQKKLEQDRIREKEEKQKRKEWMKAHETPEEKRARRLAKKLAKENKVKEDLGWGEEFMGYSNIDNPFGDQNLTQTFIWNKKLEKEGLTKVAPQELEKRIRSRVVENKEELEKFKQLRKEREDMKEEIEMMKRQQEAQQYVEWEKQEDQFHLKQSKERSKIRIREGRGKAIDLLARYISVEENEDDMDIEMHEPYHYLNGLGIRDLEDLLADIEVYRKLEGDVNQDYWRDVKTIAEEELKKLQKMDKGSAEYYSGNRREGIHTGVRKDITNLLKSKSPEELALLETQILKKLKSGGEGVDIGYWETLLSMLKAHMARARLRARHQTTLKQKLRKLKQQQKTEAGEAEEAGPSGVKEELDIEAEQGEEPDAEPVPVPEDDIERRAFARIPWDKLDDEEKEDRRLDAYNSGRYSPAFVTESSLPPATEIVDEEEDARRLEFARSNYKSSGVATSQKDAKMEAEARKGMGGDEVSFGVEAPLEQKTYLWSDKYRPRKPRYFNRVHTGFEWNKYNQTHYDLDNPPPKIVQGYKFNIFYPDSLDPSKPPEFALYPCDDPDFAILKFTAGPPYEDIAFRVVNREWEASHKRGYRCQFQNGIFQLWFQFKKYRYRR